MRTPFVIVLTLATLLIAGVTSAQQHPNQEKGFDPSKLYHFADLDSINTFNGNLIVTLPLTQTFRVGPLLSYSFTPVYNANIWDAFSYDATSLELRPCRRCNAGIGWYLSLGRLIAPSDPTNSTADPSHTFIYESPDGRDHPFTATGTNINTTVMTTDESGLRLSGDDDQKTLDFPDGTKRIYLPAGQGKWRLSKVTDPYGNHVDVDYSESTSTLEVWKLTEYQGTMAIRNHRLEFAMTANASQNSGGTTYAQTYLTKVVVAAFNQKTAEYDFVYTQTAIPYPADDSVHPPTQPDNTAKVFLLTRIDLITKDANGATLTPPLLGSYAMNYQGCTNGARCSDSGLLLSLRVPTGGLYNWTYADITYPHPSTDVQQVQHDPVPIVEHRQSTVGVVKREITDIGANAPSTWYYTYRTSPEFCQQADNANIQWKRFRQTANAVTAPDGTTNVNYYSIEQLGDPCGDDVAWPGSDYGLPFTHWAPDTSGYLSTETYAGSPSSVPPSFNTPTETAPHLNAGTLKRTKRVSPDSLTVLGGQTFSPIAERTYYGPPADGQFTEVIRSRSDFAGHYKQVTSGGHVGNSSVYRTTFTDYANAPTDNLATFSPWLFGTYTDECRLMSSAAPSTSSITSCGTSTGGLSHGAPAAKDFSWSQFCFDADTGFLKRQRSLRDTAPANGDLVSRLTPAATGDVAKEEYFGGQDSGGNELTMPSGDLCGISLGAAIYAINHEYSAGSLTRSYYDGASFNVLDRTVDKTTGLVHIDRDSAGVETTYEYDLGGRLTSITPTGTAATGFAYTSAIVGTSPPTKATATSTQNGSSTEGKRESTFTFDGFGRIIRELSQTETNDRRGHDNEYDALGRKKSETITAIFNTAYPPTKKTVTTYDFAGRPTSITTPDDASTSIEYIGAVQTNRTVSLATHQSATDSSTTNEIYDALGRLVGVTQPIDHISQNAISTTTATYGYDVADRLISVEMTGDGEPQHRLFTYDNRGFLTTETHPEIGASGNGTITYQGYDARGHAREKITGPANGAFDLVFEFDSAERLKSVKRGANVLKAFEYGDNASPVPVNSKGKITKATRYNTLSGTPERIVQVDEEYTYGGPGGALSEKKTSVKTGTTTTAVFTQGYTYSGIGDLSTLTYPSLAAATANNRTVENLYKNGILIGVTGYTVPRQLTSGEVPGITYTPAGLVNVVTHADGSTDTYAEDPNGMPRPRQVKFEKFSDCLAPTAPTITVAASVCHDSSNTASVPSVTSLQYSWSITGGTITSGSTSSTITFSALSSGVVHLAVTETSECGITTASADVNISTTSGPSAPVISAPSTVCVNSTGNSASVPQNANWTYQWSITGGTITLGGTTSTVTFTAGASGVVHLALTAMTPCGSTTATPRDVPIKDVPAVPDMSFPSSVLANSTGNVASTPSDPSLTSYAWSAVPSGSITEGSNTPSIKFTAPSSGSVSLTLTVTSSCGSRSRSQTIPVSSVLAPPAFVEAHAISDTAVRVTWTPVSGATEYNIFRAETITADNQHTYTESAQHPATNTIDDTGLSPHTTYIYRVQAKGPAGTSVYSNADYATTVIFAPHTDRRILADDWSTARIAVRAMCNAAQVTSATVCSFAEVAGDAISMPSHIKVKLSHLKELRAALDAANAVFSPYGIGYQDPTLLLEAHVTPIRLQQLLEIEQAVR